MGEESNSLQLAKKQIRDQLKLLILFLLFLPSPDSFSPMLRALVSFIFVVSLVLAQDSAAFAVFDSGPSSATLTCSCL